MAKAALPGFAQLVENRITDAIARGEFDNLPGAGRPLDLDDDLLVPEEERIAFRILKNAGCVPPEVERFAELERLIGTLDSDATAGRRLRALLVQLEAEGRSATAARAWRDYEEKMARKIEKKKPGGV